MTILGVIAATMITALKPSQYKQQGFDTQKRKMYTEIDNILLTIIEECSADTSLRTIYENCDRTTTPFVVNSSARREKFAQLFNTYVRGTYYPSGEERTVCTQYASDRPAVKLKNGTCLYFLNNSIRVDVNADEGPNEDGVDLYYHIYNRAPGDPSLEDMETAISGSSRQTCSGTVTCTCNLNGTIQNATPSKKTSRGCAEACEDLGTGGYLENYSCN